jgi:hypothetical protein
MDPQTKPTAMRPNRGDGAKRPRHGGGAGAAKTRFWQGGSGERWAPPPVLRPACRPFRAFLDRPARRRLV